MVQREFLPALVIQLDAIGRVEIPQDVAAADPAHFGVLDRYRPAVDGNVVVAAAPERDRLAVKLKPIRLGVFLWNGDGDAWHGVNTGSTGSF